MADLPRGGMLATFLAKGGESFHTQRQNIVELELVFDGTAPDNGAVPGRALRMVHFRLIWGRRLPYGIVRVRRIHNNLLRLRMQDKRFLRGTKHKQRPVLLTFLSLARGERSL